MYTYLKNDRCPRYVLSTGVQADIGCQICQVCHAKCGSIVGFLQPVGKWWSNSWWCILITFINCLDLGSTMFILYFGKMFIAWNSSDISRPQWVKHSALSAFDCQMKSDGLWFHYGTFWAIWFLSCVGSNQIPCSIYRFNLVHNICIFRTPWNL